MLVERRGGVGERRKLSELVVAVVVGRLHRGVLEQIAMSESFMSSILTSQAGPGRLGLAACWLTG